MPSFPEDGNCIGTLVSMVPDETTGIEVLLAKRVCVGCPVRLACEAEANRSLLEARIRQHGVWGGLTDEERERKMLGVAERVCRSCRLGYVGPARTATCENCVTKDAKARLMELYAARMRRLALVGRVPARQIALQLGLPTDDVATWLRANLTKEQRPPRVQAASSPPGAPRAKSGPRPTPEALKPPCGTREGRAWHRSEQRRAGQGEALSHLDCACRTNPRSTGKPKAPCGTREAKDQHRYELRKAGKPESLAELDCACRPSAAHTSSVLAKELARQANRQNSVVTSGDAGQRMAA